MVLLAYTVLYTKLFFNINYEMSLQHAKNSIFPLWKYFMLSYTALQCFFVVLENITVIGIFIKLNFYYYYLNSFRLQYIIFYCWQHAQWWKHRLKQRPGHFLNECQVMKYFCTPSCMYCSPLMDGIHISPLGNNLTNYNLYLNIPVLNINYI